MLGFLMPADVSKSFMWPPRSRLSTANVLYACTSVRSRDAQSTENSSASVRSSLHSFRRHSETLAQLNGHIHELRLVFVEVDVS